MRTYLCIDLKSFYASVECVERGLDALTTKLVVADPERTEKTICLAVSPALKALGVRNRCRVFEIPKSIEYIMATPRMQLYIDYSARIYGVYLKYIAKEDIHVYSVDEAFMDVTDYLTLYQMTAKELGMRIMQDIYDTTKITSSCGIGSNLYLAKIAMDITAKHSKDHIGELTEESFCKTLWDHRPMTDFWRIGSRTADRLSRSGMDTMRDIAHADPDLLYKLFGIDAELLIDHAWGRESATIADIKNYKPKASSLSNGQVLPRDYEYEEGKLLVREMTELLCLDLVDKGYTASGVSIALRVSGYGTEAASSSFVTATDSFMAIWAEVEKILARIYAPGMLIRGINVGLTGVAPAGWEQYDLFTDPTQLRKEKDMQKAVLSIKERFGKNAILKGTSLLEGSTAIERNNQIGGHRKG